MTAARVLDVLLVEDDVIDVLNVRRAFDRSHVTNPLFVAADGIEALEWLRRDVIGDGHRHRVVLLDLGLPRMSGVEFLRALRGDAALASTPVVILTTSSTDGEHLRACGLEVDGFLAKPVTFGSFCELMVALNKHWTLVELP